MRSRQMLLENLEDRMLLAVMSGGETEARAALVAEIQPAAAEVTVDDYTGIYDADNHGVTINGEYDYAMFSTDNEEWQSDAITYADAGNYTVYVMVGTATEELNFENTITITQKQLTITGSTVNVKGADGTTDASINVGTVEGVIDGDNVVVSGSGQFASAEVGIWDVAVTYATSGNQGANYAAPVAETLSGEIKAKEAASMVVTTLDDVVDCTDGVISLREAITVYYDEAVKTVTFAEGLEGTAYQNSQIDLTKEITVDGGEKITLDGQNKTGIFFRNENINATFKNLTFTNALGQGWCGAIGSSMGYQDTDFVVTVENCDFYDNHSASTYGGAIFVTGATLKVSDSYFSGNVSDGNDGRGGAIAVCYSALEISNSEFVNNSAKGIGGAIHTWVTNNFSVTIQGSTFSGNSGKDGGAINTDCGQLTINNSVFNSNTATGSGGAIWAKNNNGFNFSMDSTDFDQNRATGNGGAISATGVNFTFTNCDMTNNSSIGAGFARGGALYMDYVNNLSNGNHSSLNNSTITGNLTRGTMSGMGGGIFFAMNGGNMVDMRACVVDNNAAGADAYYYSQGGGIYTNGQLFFYDGSISNNQGFITDGGDGNGEIVGGGVYAIGTRLQIWNSKVVGNTLNSDAISVNTQSFGAGLYLGCTTDLVQTLVADNTIYSDGAKGRGAGVWIGKVGVTMWYSTITGNTVYSDNGRAGGIYNDEGALTVLGSLLYGNTVNGDEKYDFRNNPDNANTFIFEYSLYDSDATSKAYTVRDNCFDAKNATIIFTDAENGDYSLAAGSVAINGTKKSDAFGFEFDLAGAGHYRCCGTLVDYGAYEYQTRDVPSTVVTTLDDVVSEIDGLISIREALVYAETLDTPITYAVTGTTALKSALVVSSDISIDATGVTYTKGGEGTFAAYEVAGGNFALTGAVIDGFNHAGVFISGAPTAVLTGVTVKNSSNNDENAAGGAGVYAHNTNLTMEGCTVTGNTSETTWGFGGGVCIYGAEDVGFVSTINNSYISGNQITGGQGRGGGLALIGYGTLYLSNSHVTENYAFGGRGNGGGIYSEGTMLIDSTIISGNQIDRANDADANGGGIYNGGLMAISNSLISGNNADYGAGIINVGTGVYMYNTTIAGNMALQGGGVYNGTTFIAWNSIVACNIGIDGNADDIGGEYNTSLVGTDPNFVNYTAYNEWNADLYKNWNLMLDDDSVAIDAGDNSRAKTAADSSVMISDDLSGENRYNRTVDIGCYENQAIIVTTTIDDVVDDADISLREAIAMANNASINTHIVFSEDVQYDTIYLESTLETTGHVTIIGGGCVTIDGHDTFQLFNANGGSLTLDGLILQNGSAENGGAVYTYDATLTINDTIITGNTATAMGGAICVNEAFATVSGSTISENTAGTGGGIAVISGTLKIADTSILENTVSGNKARGGGLYNEAGTVLADNLIISGNAGYREGDAAWGGGIDNRGLLSISNSLISGNLAGIGGGTANFGTMVMKNTTVAGNMSNWEDPSLQIAASDYGTMLVYNSIIAMNVATTETNSVNLNNSVVGIDPLFVEYSAYTEWNADLYKDWDFQLSSSLSAAFNTGDNSKATMSADSQVAIPLDLEGNARFVKTVVDCGAYELQNPGTERPSTVVTTLDDVVDATDFFTSLREAVEYAKELGTPITYAVTGTSTLNSAIAISEDVSINATGVEYIMGTNGIYAAFDVTGGNFALTGATVSGFNHAGIFINGAASAALTGVTVKDSSNNDSTAGGGGGIYAYNTNLTMDACTVSGNTTESTWGFGGGLSMYNSVDGVYTATISNSVFANNSVTGGNGRGGGVALYGYGTLYMSNSSILENSSLGSSGQGGGFYNEGVALLDNVTISGNLIDRTEDRDANGGAIYNNGVIAISNSLISGNKADYGGAILSVNTLYMYNTTIAGNMALQGGGVYCIGTLLAWNSIVAGNIGVDGNPNVIGGEFNHSLIDGDPGFVAYTAYTDWNAELYKSWDFQLADGSAAINIGDNAFAKTAADSTVLLEKDLAGGKRVNLSIVDAGCYENQSAEAASTVVTTYEDVVDAYDGLISLREAVTVYAQEGDTVRFGSNLDDGTITLELGAINVAVKDLTIDGEDLILTIDADGASQIFNITANATLKNIIFTNGNGQFGGAVRAAATYIVIDGCSFIGNVANYAGAIFVADSGVTLSVTNSTFENNVSVQNGGAIYVDCNADVFFTASEFTGNATSDCGGAIFVDAPSRLTITDVTIDGNTAAGHGGGIFISNHSQLVATDSTVASNSATWAGGIYIGKSEYATSLTNVAINNNTSHSTAYAFGGGLLVLAGATVNMYGGEMVGNTAYSDGMVNGNQALGGAVYNAGVFNVNVTADGTVYKTTFAQNKIYGAGMNLGGAIYSANGGSIRLDNSEIIENVIGYEGITGYTGAWSDGAGVCSFAGSPMILVNSVVANNTIYATAAQDGNVQGAGVWSGWASLVYYTTITGNKIILDTEGEAFGAGYYESGTGATTTVGSLIQGNAIEAGNGITISDVCNIHSGNPFTFMATLYDPSGILVKADTVFDDACYAYMAGETLFAEGSYTLAEGSVAIDGTGHLSAFYATDMRGEGFYRVCGPSVDYGAFEYQTRDTASTVVTTLDDVVNDHDGLISIREAIGYAAELGTDITYAEGLTGTTTLSDTITLGQNVTINATGVTFTSAEESAFSAFAINGGATVSITGAVIDGFGTTGIVISGSANVSLSDIVVTHCVADGVRGGGIAIFDGTLSIKDSSILENTVSGGNARGAGLYNEGGTVLADNLTVAGNAGYREGDASYGGGIDNRSVMAVANSLIAGNIAGIGGGVANFGTMILKNTTVAGNMTTWTGYGIAAANFGTLLVYNSIIAQNVGETDTNTVDLNNSVVGTDPSFVSYAAYTDWSADLYKGWDFSLANDSVAINIGDNAKATMAVDSTVAIAYDLAGNTRIVKDIVDAGCYENQKASVPLDPPTGLAVASFGANRATVSWTSVENAVSYVVAYSTDLENWTEAAAADNSLVVTGLTYGTTVSYKVKAIGDEIISEDSEFSATVSAKVCPMDVDGDGRIGPADKNALSLAWFSRPGAANWDARCDVDGDGFIGPVDLSYLSRNWLKSSSSESLAYPPAAADLALADMDDADADADFESAGDLIDIDFDSLLD